LFTLNLTYSGFCGGGVRKVVTESGRPDKQEVEEVGLQTISVIDEAMTD